MTPLLLLLLAWTFLSLVAGAVIGRAIRLADQRAECRACDWSEAS